MMKLMKNDKYKKARGGWSRMYVDRMSDLQLTDERLRCPHCDAILGTKMLYKKEDRPAYRLYVGSVIKKIVRASSR